MEKDKEKKNRAMKIKNAENRQDFHNLNQKHEFYAFMLLKPYILSQLSHKQY